MPPLFERSHQPAVAIFLVAGLLGLAVYCSVGRLGQEPLVDLSELDYRATQFQVDLNSAGWAELVLLPGVGEKLAQQIVKYRETVGTFRTHEQLLQIEGIADIKFAQIRPHLLPITDTIDSGNPDAVE